jgi:hypothetical protein
VEVCYQWKTRSVNDIKGFVLAIINIQYLNKFDYINYIGNKNSKKKTRWKRCVNYRWELHFYRVIHNSLRNFRTRLRNNQDRHSRKELSSTCKAGHAPLRRDHPGYCTADFGYPGGTYELPCITSIDARRFNIISMSL